MELPRSEPSNDVIATLWARMKIHELDRYMFRLDGSESETNQEIINEITNLAIEYQVLSDYTAFLAVSEEVRTDPDGNPILVEVPVNMPLGVSYEGNFGTGGGLVPQAIGLTTITVSDQRGMHLRGGRDSQTYVSDELHTGTEIDGVTPVVHLISANPFLGLEASEIRSSIDSVLDQVLTEYESVFELSEDGTDVIAGVVTIILIVSDDGRVDRAEVASNETGDADLAEAIAEILKTVEIPEPPAGGGSVYVSINLGYI
jgi:Ca-activated chloride channel family protein